MQTLTAIKIISKHFNVAPEALRARRQPRNNSLVRRIMIAVILYEGYDYEDVLEYFDISKPAISYNRRVAQTEAGTKEYKAVLVDLYGAKYVEAQHGLRYVTDKQKVKK